MNNNVRLAEILTAVRNKTPLVHAITNYVTINDCANVLLSYGASPAMCESCDEVYDFARLASSLYINLGTLTKEQEQSVILAAESAKEHGIPVVLDPVACGAIPRKLEVIGRIHELGRIDVIKGNIGEIKFLAGLDSATRGVDSLDTGDGALEACRLVASKYGCVVAATGSEDYITDGTRSAVIKNGTELFTKITGAGCMTGALCAGAAGASEDRFLSTVSAILTMNVAGEEAAKKAAFPGSFRMNFIDSIYALDEGKLLKEGDVEWI
ncbi:MAG: hydroxyethylthiazole kinase [Firmicutes bacterium]|nr:hydroxyethylthiazole kinase [Bacillota bacterium]